MPETERVRVDFLHGIEIDELTGACRIIQIMAGPESYQNQLVFTGLVQAKQVLEELLEDIRRHII